MKQYKLTIRLSNGQLQKILITADTCYNANKMAEMQYGKSSIVISATSA